MNQRKSQDYKFNLLSHSIDNKYQTLNPSQSRSNQHLGSFIPEFQKDINSLSPRNKFQKQQTALGHDFKSLNSVYGTNQNKSNKSTTNLEKKDNRIFKMLQNSLDFKTKMNEIQNSNKQYFQLKKSNTSNLQNNKKLQKTEQYEYFNQQSLSIQNKVKQSTSNQNIQAKKFLELDANILAQEGLQSQVDNHQQQYKLQSPSNRRYTTSERLSPAGKLLPPTKQEENFKTENFTLKINQAIYKQQKNSKNFTHLQSQSVKNSNNNQINFSLSQQLRTNASKSPTNLKDISSNTTIDHPVSKTNSLYSAIQNQNSHAAMSKFTKLINQSQSQSSSFIQKIKNTMTPRNESESKYNILMTQESSFNNNQQNIIYHNTKSTLNNVSNNSDSARFQQLDQNDQDDEILTSKNQNLQLILNRVSKILDQYKQKEQNWLEQKKNMQNIIDEQKKEIQQLKQQIPEQISFQIGGQLDVSFN